MSLYTEAVMSIQTHSIARQAVLDAAALAARAAHIGDARQSCMTGVNPVSPEYLTCALVSQTLTIGREDGYPAYGIPITTRDVVRAAINAGILARRGDRNNIAIGNLALYHDASGFATLSSLSGADCAAWSAAGAYRSAQTVASL